MIDRIKVDKDRTVALLDAGATGKIVTPNGEYIVQWDHEGDLNLFTENGRLSLSPISCNAVAIQTELEDD